MVAAFGIAPDTVTDTITRSAVVEERHAACRHDSWPQPELQTYWREERIQRGDTLAALLWRACSIDDAEAMASLRSAPETRVLYQLIPGRTVRAAINAEDKLVSLRYLNGERLLTVTRDGEIFLRPKSTAAQFETRVVSCNR